MKESEGNMFNPIFKENAQGWKYLGKWAFEEPELLSYRKSKLVVQNEKNGHKNPNNSHSYHDKNHDEIKLYYHFTSYQVGGQDLSLKKIGNTNSKMPLWLHTMAALVYSGTL